MMATELTTQSESLIQNGDSIFNSAKRMRGFLQEIDQTYDERKLHDTDEQLKTFRAWAKLKKELPRIRHQLLWVEIHVYRALWNLKGEDAFDDSEVRDAQVLMGGLFVSPYTRTQYEIDGRHEISDLQLRTYMEKYPNVTTIHGLMLKIRKDNDLMCVANTFSTEDHLQNRFFENETYDTIERQVKESLGTPHTETKDVTDRLRMQFFKYVDDNKCFNVSDAIDEFLSENAITYKIGDKFAKDGLREKMRFIISGSNQTSWRGKGVPRFVTTQKRDDKGVLKFVRVPIKDATIDDLRAMSAMYQRQMAGIGKTVDAITSFIAFVSQSDESIDGSTRVQDAMIAYNTKFKHR